MDFLWGVMALLLLLMNVGWFLLWRELRLLRLGKASVDFWHIAREVHRNTTPKINNLI